MEVTIVSTSQRITGTHRPAGPGPEPAFRPRLTDAGRAPVIHYSLSDYIEVGTFAGGRVLLAEPSDLGTGTVARADQGTDAWNPGRAIYWVTLSPSVPQVERAAVVRHAL